MHAIDTLIRTALETGRATHHDCTPEDFGGWPLFRDCLSALLARHPGIRIEVSGSAPALDKVGLRAGYLNPVGIHNVGAYSSPAIPRGHVRIHFIRRKSALAPAKFADLELEAG